jgi:CheY-specific phosphatase CheX
MPLQFKIDEVLINAMIDSGEKGFKLGGKSLTCVGIGRTQPMALASVSGIIGIVGRVNGSLLVNMSEAAALQVTSGMLGTTYSGLTSEVLDGVAEVTNVIGGRMKSSLATSGYPLDNITLPAVIVGQSYFITQSRGMLTFNVTFNMEDEGVTRMQDRVVQMVLTVMTTDLKRAAPSS